MSYIDLYLLPVPLGNLPAYTKQAQTFGDAVKRYGGLSYGEFKADPNGEGNESYLKLVTLKPGEILTTATASFSSKKHRDEVMAKVMEDEQVKALMNQTGIADMSRMVYGGFEQFVSAE
jgi:uncharacterized protein YbaA (DUF1428 family)